MRAAEAAEVGGAGGRGDALVWEDIEARCTGYEERLTGSFLVFMAIAAMIAAAGILLDSTILVIGAMVVGPDYGPLVAMCVGIVRRRDTPMIVAEDARRRPRHGGDGVAGGHAAVPSDGHRARRLRARRRRADRVHLPTRRHRHGGRRPGRDHRHAVADRGAERCAGRRARVGDDDPRRGQHRRRHGVRRVGRGRRCRAPAGDEPRRVPSAGFEPAHTAPEADALSPELRGRARAG